jgi:hypothetical protein
LKLIKANVLKVEYIEGELSEIMVKKYLGDKSYKVLQHGESNVVRLISSLTHSNKISDVVFAERLIAELTPEVRNGRIINILKPSQLLYPVGFAMRREDYILRHYVNIKLMELDDRNTNGILDIIVQELQRTLEFQNIDIEFAKEYFVRVKN